MTEKKKKTLDPEQKHIFYGRSFFLHFKPVGRLLKKIAFLHWVMDLTFTESSAPLRHFSLHDVYFPGVLPSLIPPHSWVAVCCVSQCKDLKLESGSLDLSERVKLDVGAGEVFFLLPCFTFKSRHSSGLPGRRRLQAESRSQLDEVRDVEPQVDSNASTQLGRS